MKSEKIYFERCLKLFFILKSDNYYYFLNEVHYILNALSKKRELTKILHQNNRKIVFKLQYI